MLTSLEIKQQPICIRFKMLSRLSESQPLLSGSTENAGKPRSDKEYCPGWKLKMGIEPDANQT